MSYAVRQIGRKPMSPKQKRNRPTLTVTLDPDMIEWLRHEKEENRSDVSTVLRQHLIASGAFAKWKNNAKIVAEQRAKYGKT
jgi:hypothetical protein